MMHRLKIKANYYARLIEGTKKAEIRLNDRDYQRSDCIVFTDLKEIEREGIFEITHIHSGLGLEDGYICLSLCDLSEEESEAKK